MRLSLLKAAKLLFIGCILLLMGICLWNELSLFSSSTENVHHGGQSKQIKLSELVAQKGLTIIPNVRSQRSAKSVEGLPADVRLNDIIKSKRTFHIRQTSLDDIVISIKTTGRYHKTRLQLLLNTWITRAKNQTYIFTDIEDKELKQQLPEDHVINTNCSSDHSRKSLCCKMSVEFDWFIMSNKRWFCHMDDDNYVNVDQLVSLLRGYNHTEDWYLGKPSLSHPIEVMDRAHPGQKLAFWFATGGAGFCLSRAMALKMMPYAGGGRLQQAGEQIRLPDDCTIGYIIDYLLHKKLTVIKSFHSHLEALWHLHVPVIKQQITFSYGLNKERPNIVNIRGFTDEKDPTRFWSIHCHLHPFTKECMKDR